MARNVEIKARARDPQGQRDRARALADGPEQHLVQEDTFFRVSTGRLKLRCFPSGDAELIHYRRPNAAAVKTCRYAVMSVREPARMKAVLAVALGVRGVVRKRRTLLLAGRTRIHLDEVEGLGAYIELEVVLAPHPAEADPEAGGRREARRLMQALAIDDDDLVDVAYIDLLENAAQRRSRP